MRGAVLPGWVESLPTSVQENFDEIFFFGFLISNITYLPWMTGSTDGIEPGLAGSFVDLHFGILYGISFIQSLDYDYPVSKNFRVDVLFPTCSMVLLLLSAMF
jgi:hypothetical protein